MRLAAADRLSAIKGTTMFVPLLAFTLILSPVQDVPAPAPAPTLSDRYEQAMRCAGVMAAMSSVHAFTGDTGAKSRTDRNGRGFITAATGFAQSLGLPQEKLAEDFTASTTRALGSITRAPDLAVADAAIDQLNVDHDACIAMARAWVAEANGTS